MFLILFLLRLVEDVPDPAFASLKDLIRGLCLQLVLAHLIVFGIVLYPIKSFANIREIAVTSIHLEVLIGLFRATLIFCSRELVLLLLREQTAVKLVAVTAVECFQLLVALLVEMKSGILSEDVLGAPTVHERKVNGLLNSHFCFFNLFT